MQKGQLMENTPKWRYTILLIQDPIDNGYTAFFAEFPNIVVEGTSKDEAKKKLFEVAESVFEFKRNTSLSGDFLKNTQYPVSIESYNAEIAPA